MSSRPVAAVASGRSETLCLRTRITSPRAKFSQQVSSSYLHRLKSCIRCVSFGQLECCDTDAPNIGLLVVPIDLPSGQGHTFNSTLGTQQWQPLQDYRGGAGVLQRCGRRQMHETEEASSNSYDMTPELYPNTFDVSPAAQPKDRGSPRRKDRVGIDSALSYWPFHIRFTLLTDVLTPIRKSCGIYTAKTDRPAWDANEN